MTIAGGGKLFCYRIKLKGAKDCYVTARAIDLAGRKARKTFIEDVVSVEFVGDAIK